jgi:hypothetical protein
MLFGGLEVVSARSDADADAMLMSMSSCHAYC